MALAISAGARALAVCREDWGTAANAPDSAPPRPRPASLVAMAAARRILVFEWLSADGHFAGADGNLNWVVPDDEQAKAAAEGMSAADTVLFGRRTYELF